MYDDFRLEDEIGQLATPADAVREWTWNAGAERPDVEWMLHDYDVWVRNPHYTGKPGPHPEDEQYDDEPVAAAPADPDYDDIPF